MGCRSRVDNATKVHIMITKSRRDGNSAMCQYRQGAVTSEIPSIRTNGIEHYVEDALARPQPRVLARRHTDDRESTGKSADTRYYQEAIGESGSRPDPWTCASKLQPVRQRRSDDERAISPAAG